MVSSIPSMWRQELYHPLLVHLPIAIIPVATFLLLAFVILSKWGKALYLRPTFTWLLFISGISVAIAMKSGELAENVVNKVICDPTVTKHHEELAEIVMVLTFLSLTIELLRIFLKKMKHSLIQFHEKKLDVLILVLMLVSSAFLTQVGHLGASLTYQQGAGVYHPSAQCSEFE